MSYQPFVIASLALSLFAAPACSQRPTATARGSAASAGLYVSPALGLKGGTVEAALNEPFPDSFDVNVGTAPLTEKHTLKNCLDLLALGSKKYTTGLTPDDNTLHATSVRCYALSWLRTATPPAARPPARPSFEGFSFRQLQVRSLPPELALAISDQEAQEIRTLSAKGKSILALEPDTRLRPLSAEKAKLMTDDWTATLTVYAHGDFLGDGSDQLLLRWDASATGGSYTDAKIFLLAHGKAGMKVVRQY